MFRFSLTLIVILLSFGLTAQSEELYQESAANVCSRLSSSSYVDQCMAVIKKKTFNESGLEICKKQKYWNKIKECLKLIQNKHFDDQALSICTSGKYFNAQQKGCLKSIQNKVFVSNIEVNMCAKKKYPSQQVKCIQGATTKPFTGESSAVRDETKELISREEIKATVNRAYKLLRDNKNTDATLVLHDLVKELNKETSTQ